jgi:AcrR family transcriptional regulator
VRLEYDDRRQQILAAARRLFCQRPYSEVSMADLGEAAGVARGLLHHYFGSKRELYLEVVRGLVRVPAMPLPPEATALDPDEVWKLSVEGWMRLMETNRELWLTARRVIEALGLDAAAAPPELLALVRGYGGLAQEITREWLERGRLSRDQAKVLLQAALPSLIDEVLPQLLDRRPT